MAQRSGALPLALKTATDASPQANLVQDFIKAQFTILKNDKDPIAQQKARDALVREVSLPGAAAPGPSFLAVYAEALNQQLLPLAKSPSVRVRLNAAIVLYRVAKVAGNDKLFEAAATFAKDDNAGVALWAVKAAQAILPAVPKPQKLTSAVVEAARKHVTSDELVEEAYRSLTYPLEGGGQDGALSSLIGDVLKLYESRIKQYVREAPQRPDLELRGTNFLTLERVWMSKDAANSRAAIMQQLSNLIGLSAQHAAAQKGDDRKAFVDQLQKLGDALMALAQRESMPDEKMRAAGDALKKLQVGSSETEFTDRAGVAFVAIKSKFPNTDPFPKIEAEAAEAREDASESSTGSLANSAVESSSTEKATTAPDRRTPATSPQPTSRRAAGTAEPKP